MPQNDPTQTKFFGPKQGLNKAEAPLKRALPSGPNAGAPEFADEFKNLYIDPDDGVLKSRKGFTQVYGQTAGMGELGVVRYNNYDENGVANPVLFMMGRSSAHTLRVEGIAVIVEDELRHSLTIIFHPETNNYEVIHKDADTNVILDRLSLSETTPISTLSSLLTGIILGNTNAVLGQLHSIIDLEVEENVSGTLNVDILETVPFFYNSSTAIAYTNATFAEENNVLYIAIDNAPILKYDGKCLQKAGLPDPDVISKSEIIVPTQTTRSASEYASNPLWVTDNFGISEDTSGDPTIDIDKKFHADKLDQNNTASIYAVAYEDRSLQSNAVGSVNEVGGILVASNNNSDEAYIDITVSPSEVLEGGYINTRDYDNVQHLTVKNLTQNGGYESKGANLSLERGWIVDGTNDPWSGITGTLNFPVESHNLTEEYINRDLYFRVRIVSKESYYISNFGFPDPDRDVTTYTHYDYLVKTKLIEIVDSTNLVIDQNWDMYLQPGGLEGKRININYQDIYRDTGSGPERYQSDLLGLKAGDVAGGRKGLEVGLILMPGGVSVDKLINIYRSDDITAQVDSEDPYYATEYPEASFNLVTQIPNNYLVETQVVHDWYNYDLLGDLYTGINQVGESTRSEDILYFHSNLPKVAIITSFKDRLYMTKDRNSVNTVYASSLVYGPETYNVTGDDSFEISDTIGDYITGLSPLGQSGLAILKSNSTHLMQGDFATNNIRRDVINAEGFGCVSHHSISQIKDGIAYLSQEGVVYWQYDSRPKMLGSIYLNREQGSEPMSRIRQFIKRKNLGLKWAISFNDYKKEQYILHIPPIGVSTGDLGNFAGNRKGVTLVYDYMNDSWYEYENYDFRAGMAYLNDETLYKVNSIGTGDLIGNISTNITRELNTRTLVDFTENLDGTFQVIECQYDTDWDSFLEPSVTKKPMHFKIFSYNIFDDIIITSVDGLTDLSFYGKNTVLIEAYKDYRKDSLHSKNTITTDRRSLAINMKMRSQKVDSIKVSLKHSKIGASPAIMGMEMEYQLAHRGFQRKNQSS